MSLDVVQGHRKKNQVIYIPKRPINKYKCDFMIVNWTFQENDKLNAEARMLLLLMYLDAESDNFYRKPVLYMARKYQASERLIRRCLRLLIEAKVILLIPEKEVPRKRGRPVTRYQLTGIDFDELSSQFEQRPIYMRRWMNHLWYSNQHAKELTLSNRLMLTHLLSEATESGIVDSISLRDLCRFMGCTERKAQAMLSKLRRLGYIRGYIKGLSHSVLKKRKSIIFLNLSMYDQKSYYSFIAHLKSSGALNPVYNLTIPLLFQKVADVKCNKEFAEHIDYFIESEIIKFINVEGKVCTDIEWYERVIREHFAWATLKLEKEKVNKLIEFLAYRALDLARTIKALDVVDGKQFAIGINEKNQRLLLKRGA
ncbi:hypothetical protein NMR91_003540 [Vibrio alginolyticus]|nr:hypothetical protein [Vibrio alginolyticus]ELA6601582.1 hypothetical protein [Vibrio alginolyticus]